MTKILSSRARLSPQPKKSFDLICGQQQSDEVNVRASASPQSVSKTDPFAAWKSLDFWKEQSISFIPLMTGLAVTGGLGINGLASIPIYLITADATRRVIDYLEPQFSALQTSKNSNTASAIKGNKTQQPPISKVEQESASINELLIKSVDKASNVAAPAKIAYSIAHVIPGRIRFNVPRLARDHAYARRFERLLKSDPEVTSVRVNCDAASVAIAHKSGEIPLSHWVGLMQLAEKEIPQTIPIQTTTQVSQSTHLRESTLELANLWADFKPPILSAALDLMANFPLEFQSLIGIDAEQCPPP